MGRTHIEMCKFLGCLPSELYQKHNPTLGDYYAVSAYWRILQEEEVERLSALAKAIFG